MRQTSRQSGEAGFSLIEVVVGMLILTIGLLAMAGTTGAVFTQLRIAERRTERMAAVQQAAEQLYSVGYSNAQNRCGTLNQLVGSYRMTCSATQLNPNLLQLRIISTGPGYRSKVGWRMSVPDTFAIQIAR